MFLVIIHHSFSGAAYPQTWKELSFVAALYAKPRINQIAANRHRGDAGRAEKHVNSPMVATTVNILKPRWLFGKIKGFMSSLLFGIPGISGNGSRCFRPFLHPSPQPSAMFEFMTPIPLQFLFWRGWLVLIWRARPRPRSLRPWVSGPPGGPP